MRDRNRESADVEKRSMKKQYKNSVQVSSTAYIEMFKVTCVFSCVSHCFSFYFVSADSLSFMDSMSHAGSTEAELFRADLCRTPDSCQGMFNSRTTGSSSSPLPHTDRYVPIQYGWLHTTHTDTHTNDLG